MNFNYLNKKLPKRYLSHQLALVCNFRSFFIQGIQQWDCLRYRNYIKRSQSWISYQQKQKIRLFFQLLTGNTLSKSAKSQDECASQFIQRIKFYIGSQHGYQQRWNIIVLYSVFLFSIAFKIQCVQEIAVGNPLGKIFKLDIQRRLISVVVEGLYFPWGIVLEQDEDSVLVSQTSRHRVTRISLKGSNKKKVILSNLQGFPAGLSLQKNDKLWVTFYDLRGYASDLIDSSPFLKSTIINLPSSFTQETYYGSKYIGGIQVNLKKTSKNNQARIDNYLFLKADKRGSFWKNHWLSQLRRVNKIIQHDTHIYMSSWLYSQIFRINKQEYIQKRKQYHKQYQEEAEQF